MGLMRARFLTYQDSSATHQAWEHAFVVPVVTARGGHIDLFRESVLHVWLHSEEVHSEGQRVGRCIMASKVDDEDIANDILDGQTS